MRVLLVLGDHSGCAFYRMEMPGAVAIQNGIDVTILDGLPGRVVGGQIKVDFETISDTFDVVVIQRPLRRNILQAIEPLKKVVKVAVEVDDDFTTLHPKNQAYWSTHPANKETPFNREYVREACEIAHHVIVSTPALAEVYGNGKCSVVPNVIPDFLLDWEFKKVNGMIGWTGNISTHPGDLEVTQGAVEKTLRKTGGFFAVIGQGDGVKKALRLTQREIPESGWVPINEYYQLLGRLSVGIVPLQRTPFNAAKSNLKGLEFAATGVPYVASPLPEYVRLRNMGVGVLAHNKDGWYLELRRLMSDFVYRDAVRQTSRMIVRQNYTIEHNWFRWAEAWERTFNA